MYFSIFMYKYKCLFHSTQRVKMNSYLVQIDLVLDSILFGWAPFSSIQLFIPLLYKLFLHLILVEFSVPVGVSNKNCLTPVGDSLGFIYTGFLKPVEVSCRCFRSERIHNLIWGLGRRKLNDSVPKNPFSFISLRFLVVDLRNHVTYWSTETLLMTCIFQVIIYKKKKKKV